MTDGHTQRHAEELPTDPDVTAQARLPAGHLLRDRGDLLLVIAAGGALGSLGRWAVSQAVPSAPWRIPWGTWVENVSGGLALGLLMVFVLEVWPPRRYLRPFLGVGVLGGYTTFSTYMLDTRALLADGHAAAAFGYLFGTLITGLLAVAAGVLLARVLVRIGESRRRRRHEQHTRDPAEARTGQPGRSDAEASNPDIIPDPSARSIR
ncbi:MAG: CrcB family protein [Nocardioides sp.]